MTELIGAQATNTLPAVLTDPTIAGPLMMSVWQARPSWPTSTTSPGSSPRSSASSGRRRRAATTCIATCCCATARLAPARCFPSRPGTARTRRSSGPGWSPTSSAPAAARSRFRTTATCRTAACSPRRASTARRCPKDYAERRQRWEPMQEIVQMKGASESHPSCRRTMSSWTTASRAGNSAT